MATRNAEVLVVVPSATAPNLVTSNSCVGNFGGTIRLRISGTAAQGSAGMGSAAPRTATLEFIATSATRQSKARQLTRCCEIIAERLTAARRELNWEFVQTAFDFVPNPVSWLEMILPS